MEHIYYTCDKCNKKLLEKQTLSLKIDRVPDGVGGMENEYKNLDLCFNCLKSLVEKYFHYKDRKTIEEFLGSGYLIIERKN